MWKLNIRKKRYAICVPSPMQKACLEECFKININCIAAIYKLITEINEMEIVCPATKALGSTGNYLLFYLVHLQDKVSLINAQFVRHIWLTCRIQIWNWRSKAHLFHKSNPVNLLKIIPLLQPMIHSHHPIPIGIGCAFPYATTPWHPSSIAFLVVFFVFR